MKYLLALYILLVNCSTIMSQTVIKGNVSESVSGKSIVGANVMAKNLNGKLIGFSLSDEEGKFSIKINESADSMYISSTMIGYKPFSTKIRVDDTPLTIIME